MAGFEVSSLFDDTCAPVSPFFSRGLHVSSLTPPVTGPLFTIIGENDIGEEKEKVIYKSLSEHLPNT